MTALLNLTALSLNHSFTKDVQDWFACRRAGHMSKWLYSEPQFADDKANGAIRWSQAIERAKNGSPYYVFREEQSIIEDAAPQISSLFNQSTSLIDLGPGSKDAIQRKIKPIRLNGNGHIAEYIGVDVSNAILAESTVAWANIDPNLPVQALHANFFEDNFIYPAKAEQTVACFFGLTICNMAIDPRTIGLPERLLASYFTRLRSHMGQQPGYMLVTQDTNQNETSLTEAYQEIGDHFKALLYAIARDVNIIGDFDPDAFELDMRFFPKTQAFGLCFVPVKNMRFSIDKESFELIAGQELYFHNAFKFDIPTFQKAAFAGGFQIQDTIQNGSRCVLHVLRHP